MAGTVIIPWYATGLRAKAFAVALEEVAPAAMRYGASSYGVYQSQDDLYKFQQFATFEEHLDWDRFWGGEEMTAFRSRYAGWYQIPVLYSWWSELTGGAIGGAVADPEEEALRA